MNHFALAFLLCLVGCSDATHQSILDPCPADGAGGAQGNVLPQCGPICDDYNPCTYEDVDPTAGTTCACVHTAYPDGYFCHLPAGGSTLGKCAGGLCK